MAAYTITCVLDTSTLNVVTWQKKKTNLRGQVFEAHTFPEQTHPNKQPNQQRTFLN